MNRLAQDQQDVSHHITQGLQTLINAHPELTLAEKNLLNTIRDFILQFPDHMKDASHDGLNAIKTTQKQLNNLMHHSHKVVHDALKSQEKLSQAAQRVIDKAPVELVKSTTTKYVK